MAKKMEYAIWGNRNGMEDIIRVNGQEVQDSLAKAKKIKQIVERRGEFTKIRIQKIDFSNPNLKSAFIKGVR